MSLLPSYKCPSSTVWYQTTSHIRQVSIRQERQRHLGTALIDEASQDAELDTTGPPKLAEINILEGIILAGDQEQLRHPIYSTTANSRDYIITSQLYVSLLTLLSRIILPSYYTPCPPRPYIFPESLNARGQDETRCSDQVLETRAVNTTLNGLDDPFVKPEFDKNANGIWASIEKSTMGSELDTWAVFKPTNINILEGIILFGNHQQLKPPVVSAMADSPVTNVPLRTVWYQTTSHMSCSPQTSAPAQAS